MSKSLLVPVVMLFIYWLALYIPYRMIKSLIRFWKKL